MYCFILFDPSYILEELLLFLNNVFLLPKYFGALESLALTLPWMCIHSSGPMVNLVKQYWYYIVCKLNPICGIFTLIGLELDVMRVIFFIL